MIYIEILAWIEKAYANGALVDALIHGRGLHLRENVARLLRDDCEDLNVVPSVTHM